MDRSTFVSSDRAKTKTRSSSGLRGRLIGSAAAIAFLGFSGAAHAVPTGPETFTEIGVTWEKSIHQILAETGYDLNRISDSADALWEIARQRTPMSAPAPGMRATRTISAWSPGRRSGRTVPEPVHRPRPDRLGIGRRRVGEPWKPLRFRRYVPSGDPVSAPDVHVGGYRERGRARPWLCESANTV